MGIFLTLSGRPFHKVESATENAHGQAVVNFVHFRPLQLQLLIFLYPWPIACVCISKTGRTVYFMGIFHGHSKERSHHFNHTLNNEFTEEKK